MTKRETVRFQVSNSKILIKIKILNYYLENFNQDKKIELLTGELKSR